MTQQCGSENIVQQLETHWKWYKFFLVFHLGKYIHRKKKTTGQLHSDIECMPLVSHGIYSGH